MKLKKLICVVMSLLFVMSAFGLTAFANEKNFVSVSDGINALRNEFYIDKASSGGGYALDYACFSPTFEGDTNKYPVVLFLHGIGHGGYKGSQLDDSDMPYWASSELQQRFTEGGAFIVLPRAPEDSLVYWNKSLIEAVRCVIDDIIAKYGNNVDASKIFIAGASAGGEMTVNMIKAFPEYFAGAVVMAPTGTYSSQDTSAFKNVPVWLISSSKDPVISYPTSIVPLWNNIIKTNKQPDKCRFSVISDVKIPSGSSASDNHHVAKVITYDFHMLDGSAYVNTTHKDGNGNTLNLTSPNGIIGWMNTLSSEFGGEKGDGSGNVSVSGFTKIFAGIRNFFLKIVDMFQRLFGLK